MNRIQARFEALAKAGQAAFIPYITAGDPSLDATARIVDALEAAGADIIEFGVPFSDPIADGAVNQEAALRALANGTTLHDVVALVKRLRGHTQIPIVLFTYYNPVLAYNVETFATDCREAGVDGVLCVDLPPEEDERYKASMDAAGVATIYLVAPTSTPDRIALIASQSTGFIYYVSRTGVTGERADLEAGIRAMVGEIKSHTNKPVAVGFGISTPEQAAEVGTLADGVIVGSAIVRLIGQLGDSAELIPRLHAMVAPLARAAKTRRP